VESGEAACAVVPLVVGGETLGALGFDFDGPRRFAAEDRAFVVMLASQAAVALDRDKRCQREALHRRRLADALEARDRFVAVSAHELNTPLTSLRGYLQLLRRSADRGVLPPVEELWHVFQTVEAQADRLAYLVSQLLGLARLSGGGLQLAPRRTNVAGLVRRAVRRVSHVGRGPTFVTRAPRALHAHVDPERLRESVEILLDNAAKYGPRGSDVDVELRRCSSSPPMLELAVRDFGPGVPSAHRPKIFDQFYRGAMHAGAIEGLGLGLFICKRLVELHGGTLSAEYPLDGGTRMVLRLPG